MLSAKSYCVVSVGVEWTELDFVGQAHVVHQALYLLSFGCAADEVHPRVELHTVALEALEASSYLVTLFEDGYVVTVLLQDIAACESA